MPLPSNLSELDPFTQVYLVLGDSLLNSAAVRSIVTRDANIVRFDVGALGAMERDKLKPGDLPELVLWSRNLSGNFNLATNVTEIMREYILAITTDTGKITETLFPLEWAIACWIAQLTFKQQLRDLTWRGTRFVQDVRFIGGDSGQSDPTFNRGLKGWAATWRFQVKMYFSQAEIKLYETTLG